MRYHFTLTNMAVIKKTISIGKDVKKLEISYVAQGNVKWGSHFGKQFVSLLNIKHQVTI